MKKLALFFIVFLVSCSSRALENIDSVAFHEMESFSEVKEESVFIITEEEEIRRIQLAVQRAKQEPGIMDMMDPPYAFDLGEASYFLWPESGTIMDQADTHTIYTLRENDHENVIQTLEEKRSEK